MQFQALCMVSLPPQELRVCYYVIERRQLRTTTGGGGGASSGRKSMFKLREDRITGTNHENAQHENMENTTKLEARTLEIIRRAYTRMFQIAQSV